MSVLSIGYVGDGRHKTKKGGKHTPQYGAWRKMLTRCYDAKYHMTRPTYEECRVCEDWHDFQVFADWYKDNYYQIEDERMELDKDILVKGNKVYAPEKCVFVPQRINGLLNRRGRDRGEYPIGVHLGKRDKRFLARCHDINGNLIRLGRFDTPEEAFRCYKAFKEQVIRSVAELYSINIPAALYEALINYRVEMDD